MEVSSHALALGRVDGARFDGRRVHQPVPGPPGLPPRHRGLLRGEGAAVRRPLRARGRHRRRPYGRRLVARAGHGRPCHRPATPATPTGGRRGRRPRRTGRPRFRLLGRPDVDAAGAVRAARALQRRQRAAGDRRRWRTVGRAPRPTAAAACAAPRRARAGWSGSTPARAFLARRRLRAHARTRSSALLARAAAASTTGPADRGARLRRRPRPGQAPADGRGGADGATC